MRNERGFTPLETIDAQEKAKVSLTGFTLVEALIAVAIFTIIITLILVSLVALFRSLRQSQQVMTREQKQRLLQFRLSNEISSIVKGAYAKIIFKGVEGEFSFIFAREENLGESRYVFNAANSTLERYYQEPADYDFGTYDKKEGVLSELVSCKFSYSDGKSWAAAWDENNAQLPTAIKMVFKFKDENQEREFQVNIPVSQ